MKKKFQHTNPSGFKVPKGYFDSLESKILDKSRESTLLKTQINSGFKVPENYFDDFKVETHKTNVISWKKVAYISSIAATITLLFTLLLPKEPSFENLETATIEDYLLFESYETQEMASIFDETDLTLETFNLNVDQEVIEDYLLENIDIDNLIEY